MAPVKHSSYSFYEFLLYIDRATYVQVQAESYNSIQLIMPVMRPVKLSDPHQEVDPDGDPHFRRSEGIR